MRKLEEWIDFMEDEGTLKKRAELGMLLRHSSEDQIVLDNLVRLRRLIELCDPADEIEGVISNPAYLERMHSQILSAVAAPTMEGSPARPSASGDSARPVRESAVERD